MVTLLNPILLQTHYHMELISTKLKVTAAGLSSDLEEDFTNTITVNVYPELAFINDDNSIDVPETSNIFLITGSLMNLYQVMGFVDNTIFIDNSGMLSITVPTGGNGEYNYEWQKFVNDGMSVVGSDSNNFTPTENFNFNESPYLFKVVVSSYNCDEIDSETIQINVNQNPEDIEIDPIDIEICENENNQYIQILSPETNHQYNWYSNSSDIEIVNAVDGNDDVIDWTEIFINNNDQTEDSGLTLTITDQNNVTNCQNEQEIIISFNENISPNLTCIIKKIIQI